MTANTAPGPRPEGVDVVVVAYRCEALLRSCLASLSRNRPSRPMSVWVVDNASNDGTADMVAREFPWVELIRCDTNLGFSAGNNVAIRRGDAAYVLALNPDTRVEPGSLDRLLALMDARPELGVSGPALTLENGEPDHAAKRSFPTPLSALGHFARVGRRMSSGRLAAYRAPAVEAGPVDSVNGAFMLMRRAALDQVGLFDEGYWMYMEDLDLSYRLAQAGWVTWFEPAARVVHVKAGTSGVRRPRLNYHFHYGMLRFYRKHYADDRRRLTNAVIYAGIAVKLVLSVGHSVVSRRLTPAARGAVRQGAR